MNFWHFLTSRIRSRCYVLLLIAIPGCASLNPEPTVPISLLLSPSSFGGTLSLSQLVTGEYDNQTTSMRFEIDITPDRLTAVALSPLGITLFTLEHDGGEPIINQITSDQIILDPKYILFDLYMAYWPTAVLHNALGKHGLKLHEDHKTKKRIILTLSDEKLVEVMYPVTQIGSEEIVIQHYALPYRLNIKSLKD